eukprot:CAMPEP_0198501666 /NCGR_PEP_ID=MMETSP1462-20131121/8847_1 /TAXON_ID=1333877 /ORGANISM="Brandtodinium nutriculum, Strain RCC3387" /LENGTH=124 /DNA_ID=CAMNT_0044230719 /DNA_START=81 /DNA_END=452 /DNA_ORIENTATION=-
MANDLMQFEFMSLLNIFFCIAMGAFVLKEDPHLKSFYACLSTSIFQMCAERGMGGPSCLFPFLVFDAVNFVFDLLMKSRLLGLHAYGLALAGTLVAQASCAYFTWTVIKVTQAVSDPNAVEMGG